MTPLSKINPKYKVSDVYKQIKDSSPDTGSIVRYCNDNSYSVRDSIRGDSELVTVYSVAYYALHPDPEATRYVSKFISYFCLNPQDLTINVRKNTFDGLKNNIDKKFLCSLYEEILKPSYGFFYYCTGEQFSGILGLTEDECIC